MQNDAIWKEKSRDDDKEVKQRPNIENLCSGKSERILLRKNREKVEIIIKKSNNVQIENLCSGKSKRISTLRSNKIIGVNSRLLRNAL